MQFFFTKSLIFIRLDQNDAWSKTVRFRWAQRRLLLKKNSHEIFGWTARCERKIVYTTIFWTNFEQNCHQNTKQDSGQISNFGFRFRNRCSFRNPKLIFKIEAPYSSRISFRDIKIRILRLRFGQNLAPWIFLQQNLDFHQVVRAMCHIGLTPKYHHAILSSGIMANIMPIAMTTSLELAKWGWRKIQESFGWAARWEVKSWYTTTKNQIFYRNR